MAVNAPECYIDEIARKIRSAVPASSLPDDTEALFRIYAVLLLARGSDVSSQDVHNAWVAWMVTKDPGHEALVPYATLSDEVQRQDDPYVTAIRRTWRDLNNRSDPPG